MTLRKKIKEIIQEATGHTIPGYYYPSDDKYTDAILSAVRKALPEEKEITMYDGAVKYPEDDGWNACLSTVRERLQ